METDKGSFEEFLKEQQLQARQVPRGLPFNVDLVVRGLAVLLVITIIASAALFTWQRWPREAKAAAPYAVLQCEALDLTLDGVPDVLSCPGGAYMLSPFEAGP